MKNITVRENKGINGLTENRFTDHCNEEFFRDILDNNLYRYIPDFTYERKGDRESQLKGIDISGQMNGHPVYIDEKVQTSKAFVPENRKRGTFIYNLDGEEKVIKTACTPTFCFELSCCKLTKKHRDNPDLSTYGFNISADIFNPDRYPGWFIDAEKETKQYICVWPHNLQTIEVMMISRDELINCLQSRGLTDEIIAKALTDIQQEAIRKTQEDSFKANKYKAPVRYYQDCLKNDKGEYDAWFTSSVYNLAEAPINLICRKNFLLSLPNTKHWIMLPKEERLLTK